MDNIMVKDTCEVYLKDLTSGKQYFFGITSKGEVTQKVKQDILKGGIGNGVVGVVQSDKEITFKVSTLLHNDGIYEVQSGALVKDGTATVQKTESIQCAKAGELSLVGTPKGTAIVVMDETGKQIAGTFATGKFTSTQPTDLAVGAVYTAVYPTDVTNAEILTLDSKLFPTNYYVELHTIAYNVNTNQVTSDIFWQFYKALPDGGLKAQYDAGKNNGDEINFKAQLPVGSSEYGQYVVVPR